MKDSAWENTDDLPQLKGNPFWLRAIISVSAFLLIFLSILGLRARNGRVTAWLGFRNVMVQISNEADAKALYRRSPDLASRYPNEARFLGYLKTYQSVIQLPPIDEPPNDGGRYRVFPLPTSTSVKYRFEDGTIVSIRLNSPGLFRSFPEGQVVLGYFDIQALRMLTVQNP